MVFSSIPSYLDPLNWQQVSFFFSTKEWIYLFLFLCNNNIFLNIPADFFNSNSRIISSFSLSCNLVIYLYMKKNLYMNFIIHMFCSNQINISCFHHYPPHNHMVQAQLSGPVRYRIKLKLRQLTNFKLVRFKLTKLSYHHLQRQLWSVLVVNQPTQNFATTTTITCLNQDTFARHVGVIGQEGVH